MAKLFVTTLDQLALTDREEAPAEHPIHTRAEWAAWKAENTWYRKSDPVMTDYAAWLRVEHYEEMPKARDNFTTGQMRAIAEMIIEELRTTKGYDEVLGGFTFTVDEVGYRLHISARDTWQKDVPYDYKSYQEGFEVRFTETQEIWDALRAVPNRERRELEVLLRQTNNFSQMAKELRGQAAKAFAKELIALASKHQNLLTNG